MACKTHFNPFDELIVELAKNITTENLETMKVLCQSIISNGELEDKIKSPLDLLKKLRKINKISSIDTSFLELLLKKADIHDLASRVTEFSQSRCAISVKIVTDINDQDEELAKQKINLELKRKRNEMEKEDLNLDIELIKIKINKKKVKLIEEKMINENLVDKTFEKYEAQVEACKLDSILAICSFLSVANFDQFSAACESGQLSADLLARLREKSVEAREEDITITITMEPGANEKVYNFFGNKEMKENSKSKEKTVEAVSPEYTLELEEGLAEKGRCVILMVDLNRNLLPNFNLFATQLEGEFSVLLKGRVIVISVDWSMITNQVIVTCVMDSASVTTMEYIMDHKKAIFQMLHIRKIENVKENTVDFEPFSSELKIKIKTLANMEVRACKVKTGSNVIIKKRDIKDVLNLDPVFSKRVHKYQAFSRLLSSQAQELCNHQKTRIQLNSANDQLNSANDDIKILKKFIEEKEKSEKMSNKILQKYLEENKKLKEEIERRKREDLEGELRGEVKPHQPDMESTQSDEKKKDISQDTDPTKPITVDIESPQSDERKKDISQDTDPTKFITTDIGSTQSHEKKDINEFSKTTLASTEDLASPCIESNDRKQETETKASNIGSAELSFSLHDKENVSEKETSSMTSIHQDSEKEENMTPQHSISTDQGIQPSYLRAEPKQPSFKESPESTLELEEGLAVVVLDQDTAIHRVKVDKERLKKDLIRVEEREKCCASSLKNVHKSKTQHRWLKKKLEAVCLEELGDIYLEKGKLTNSGRDYTKSAGLYNAAIVRYNEEGQREIVKRKLTKLIKIFVETELRQHSCDEYIAKYTDDISRNKQALQKLRDDCKQELDGITNKYPAYEKEEFIKSLNEMTKETYQLERDRAEAIEQLYLQISSEIKSFVDQLLMQCIDVMGQPPCKYALIGLGSLARDLATPYSDLESAILIEEDREEYKCYFRLLSYFLHIKVIDLGETIVPALAITSLNDFIGKNDWFFDSKTPRGFSFDGAMPWASKIPHGREATPSKREPMELIKIPAQMADLLTEESAAQEGYHLADIMVDATLISGDKELVDQYKHCCDHILSKSSIKVSRNTSTAMECDEIKSVKQARGYSNLLDGINEFNISSTVVDSAGKSYHVKREIFRFPTITINSLAWVFNITSSNLWNAVKELEKRQVINLDAKQNLHVIISLAAELRLASYIKHGRQREELVVRESGGSDGGMLLSSNQQKIVRYYFTALPFKDTIESILNKNTSNSNLAVGLQNNPLYQCTDNYRGQIYERLMMYSEAEVSYKSALEERGEETPELYLDLAWLEIQLGKFDEAKKCVHTHSEKYPGKQPARVSSYLGSIYEGLGDYDKAVAYHQESLAMSKQIYGEHAAHPDIASSLGNLGAAWKNKGDYDKAVAYCQESLAMQKQIYGEHATHPDIASSLGNLGNLGIAWESKGDYDKAVAYHQESLAMRKQIYGEHAAHPDIASSLNNLGNVW